MKLSTLAPNKGARKKAKLLGRGEATGHGKTCGKGNKGQKARAGGKIRPGFEGGQMPLYRRIPKIGFYARIRTEGRNRYNLVNLSVLENFKDGATVDLDSLILKGYGKKTSRRAGVKILGDGELSKKNLHVKVDAISEKAKSKIEALGGKVELVVRKTATATQA